MEKKPWMSVVEQGSEGMELVGLPPEIRPAWDEWRVPLCSDECPQHDGKRCRITGHRPEQLCEPGAREMSKLLDSAVLQARR